MWAIVKFDHPTGKFPPLDEQLRHIFVASLEHIS